MYIQKFRKTVSYFQFPMNTTAEEITQSPNALVIQMVCAFVKFAIQNTPEYVLSHEFPSIQTSEYTVHFMYSHIFEEPRYGYRIVYNNDDNYKNMFVLSCDIADVFKSNIPSLSDGDSGVSLNSDARMIKQWFSTMIKK